MRQHLVNTIHQINAQQTTECTDLESNIEADDDNKTNIVGISKLDVEFPDKCD